MLSMKVVDSSRFASQAQGRGLQQFLERRLVQHLSAWVLGHCRGCVRRDCHWGRTCPHDPVSDSLEGIEWHWAEKGLRPYRCRGLCPDYRKRDAVRSRPWVYQLSTATEYLLRNPSVVPCPIGVGSPELLPGLVQIVQGRE